MSSKQAEQISAMGECDLMVWQNFALIGISCEALLFLLYFHMYICACAYAVLAAPRFFWGGGEFSARLGQCGPDKGLMLVVS